MFSTLRNRYGIPSVIATVVLVFAMTGGAFAAKKYIITSPKQIKPSVLKKLKGAKGPAGAAGAAGAQGAQGPAGAAGAAGNDGAIGATGEKGATGTAGAKGATGATGPEGPAGKDGETGFTATLPSGETETGSWTAVVAAQFEFEEGQFFGVGWGAISFNIPLASPLDAEHVVMVQDDQEGELGKCSNAAETTKGTSANPLASPGFLCVYVGGTAGEQAKAWSIFQAGDGTNGASTSGARVVIGGTESPFAPAGELAVGTYAVTAP